MPPEGIQEADQQFQNVTAVLQTCPCSSRTQGCSRHQRLDLAKPLRFTLKNRQSHGQLDFLNKHVMAQGKPKKKKIYSKL